MTEKFLSFVFCLFFSTAPLLAEDALDRLTQKKLAAVREATTQFAQQRREVKVERPFRDYRANLHVHSLLSHDSRITLSEILVAAKKAGSEVLMFTDHPPTTTITSPTVIRD